MAIGEHPQRTPLYGIALLIGVMVAATVVTMAEAPTGVRIAVYVVGALVAIIGGALTLRDLS
ncbi:hypothetical protein [Tomitella biformata]|uniref:hypothetical protein n=1 Tax=Tomitella biformata TaxID=630403 RepID=UPI0004666895|nr:hypothetical protein [Tomitella biformata]